jgi:hypothetical protein
MSQDDYSSSPFPNRIVISSIALFHFTVKFPLFVKSFNGAVFMIVLVKTITNLILIWSSYTTYLSSFQSVESEFIILLLMQFLASIFIPFVCKGRIQERGGPLFWGNHPEIESLASVFFTLYVLPTF